MKEKCTFAHSVEELVPISCMYGSRCYNQFCNRFHPGTQQTKEQYMAANNMTFNPPAPQPHPQTIPSFVVRLEEEEDEDEKESPSMKISDLPERTVYISIPQNSPHAQGVFENAEKMNMEMLSELWQEEQHFQKMKEEREKMEMIQTEMEMEEVMCHIEFEQNVKTFNLMKDLTESFDFIAMMDVNEKENDAEDQILIDMEEFENEVYRLF